MNGSTANPAVELAGPCFVILRAHIEKELILDIDAGAVERSVLHRLKDDSGRPATRTTFRLLISGDRERTSRGRKRKMTLTFGSIGAVSGSVMTTGA